MSRMNSCNICHVEWDPDLANHRTGQDCVPVLADKIKAFSMLVLRLQKDMDHMLETRDEVEAQAFEHIAQEVGSLRAEFLAMLARFEASLDKKEGGKKT